MHTIKLTVEDNVYHNITFLLKNLKIDGLKIEDNPKQNSNTKESVKQLFDLKKENLFQDIKDPLEWQKELRDEWR